MDKINPKKPHVFQNQKSRLLQSNISHQQIFLGNFRNQDSLRFQKFVPTAKPSTKLSWHKSRSKNKNKNKKPPLNATENVPRRGQRGLRNEGRGLDATAKEEPGPSGRG